jgi:class 3 adenylate cyclase
MGSLPDDPRLAEWVKALEPTRWPVLVLDSEWRLVWVSDELKAFIHETDETALGYGRHIVEAMLGDTWLRSVTPESAVRMLNDLAPYLSMTPEQREEMAERLGEPFATLIRQIEPKPTPFVVSGSFDYVAEGGEPYRVDLVATRVLDEDGRMIGLWANTYMALRPNLVALLARGDEAMYERMAKLVEPGRRQAAILFADLQASGSLSRRLPSSAYFRLVRDLTTTVDRVVAKFLGVTGKHAGDGVSAYFLVDDLGSASQAAGAAVRAAHEIRALGREIFEGALPEDEGLDDPAGLMNIGLHWGASLYMGQLVPGGRLDVTALGDEVNECARIQESARGGAILASKALLEQLTGDDAAAAGLDPEKIVYQPLSRWATVTEKAVRDAGGVAVTEL